MSPGLGDGSCSTPPRFALSRASAAALRLAPAPHAGYGRRVATPELESTLRQALATAGNLRLALLFGSEARGTASPDSDVDLAVVGENLDILRLIGTLSTALGREVDVIDLNDAPVALIERVVREGIVMHEGFPGAGALWRAQTLATLETDRPAFARMQNAWLARVQEKGLPHG